jgi:D-3-phosphoglycerate dehydrogenase / 2-oxoglutarate reductase
MSAARPLIVATDPEWLDLDHERAILEPAGFEVVRAQGRSPEEVVDSARGAVGVLVQYATIDESVLAALPELRIVSRYGAGVDSVDLPAAETHRVWVANVPDTGTEEVAAHASAMLLGVIRHLPHHDHAIRGGTWDFKVAGSVPRLSELTLGLVGFGRIGRAVAEGVGHWFGRVVAYDPYASESGWPATVDRLGLEELFAASNAVSLHLPLGPETQELVGAALLDRMPPASYLVNTARGGLVDPEALRRALDDGRLAGAGLDVLAPEPPPADHPLLGHDAVTLSPHAAWFSDPALVDLRRAAADNIVRWWRDGTPRRYVVGPTA